MKNWIGKTLVGIGLLHTALGLIFLREIGALLLAEGLFNTVNRQPPREAFFWFIFAGLEMILLGLLVHDYERRRLAFPRFLGWFLLGLALITVLIMPASGGWLVLLPAIALIVKSGR